MVCIQPNAPCGELGLGRHLRCVAATGSEAVRPRNESVLTNLGGIAPRTPYALCILAE
jgi:hypothetical protein